MSSELEGRGGVLRYRYDPDIGNCSRIVRTALYCPIQADEQPCSLRPRANQTRPMKAGNATGRFVMIGGQAEHVLYSQDSTASKADACLDVGHPSFLV